MKKLQSSINLGVISVICFIIIWEMAVNTGFVDPVYVGVPHKIAAEFLSLITSDVFRLRFLNSFQAFGLGFLLALFLGVPIGIVLGLNKKINEAFSPFIFAFNTIPYVAILPLLIVWFGLGIVAKTVIVFLMVSSPIIIYTLDSMKSVDKDLVEMADSFGASMTFKANNLYLYHSMPNIFSALRIGVGRGMTAIIVSEIFGLGKGIAYDIPLYGATFQTNKLMASVLIILVINIVLISVLKYARRKIVYWENV